MAADSSSLFDDFASMDAKDRFAFMLLERLDRLTDDMHELTKIVSNLNARVPELPDNLTAVPGWLDNKITFTVTAPIAVVTKIAGVVVVSPHDSSMKEFVRRLSNVILDDNDDGFDMVNITSDFADGEIARFRCQCLVSRNRLGATYLMPWLTRAATRLVAHLQCSVRVDSDFSYNFGYQGMRWKFRKGCKEGF
jgi:hypothetical protein